MDAGSAARDDSHGSEHSLIVKLLFSHAILPLQQHRHVNHFRQLRKTSAFIGLWTLDLRSSRCPDILRHRGYVLLIHLGAIDSLQIATLIGFSLDDICNPSHTNGS